VIRFSTCVSCHGLAQGIDIGRSFTHRDDRGVAVVNRSDERYNPAGDRIYTRSASHVSQIVWTPFIAEEEHGSRVSLATIKTVPAPQSFRPCFAFGSTRARNALAALTRSEGSSSIVSEMTCRQCSSSSAHRPGFRVAASMVSPSSCKMPLDFTCVVGFSSFCLERA
jgi:hypothetical protein